jgi:pimeloyl-ACP methyl ester carboxylesterase
VQYVDDFVRLIPNATSEVIPGAGHMLLAEALDAVIDVILRRDDEGSIVTGGDIGSFAGSG